MKRFIEIDGIIHDLLRGKTRSREELYLMIGDASPEEKEFIIDYLQKCKFRSNISISETIAVRNRRVIVKSLEIGVTPFSSSLESVVGNQTVLHPDGLEIVPLTLAEQINLKIIADTYYTLYQ